jgi:rubrerythrin
MDTNERLDALEVALKNELQEREFYLKNAERTANPLGRAMFLQIADDELEHYERLKLLREQWVQRKQWPESLPLTVKETRVKDVLQNILNQSEKIPAGDTDDLSALNAAIDFEAKGVAHYSNLRDNVADPKQKHFFDLLAEIEREHYQSLRDSQEFLTDPASWYRTRERHGLDGG